jgi:hypothetical protein
MFQNGTTGSPTGTALYSSFDSVNVANSDVLLKYTYSGDAILSGKGDDIDYSRIDSAYGTIATGWYNGDFNYDGVINGSDYTLMDNAFSMQGAQLASAITTDQIAGPVAAVPAPASGCACSRLRLF